MASFLWNCAKKKTNILGPKVKLKIVKPTSRIPFSQSFARKKGRRLDRKSKIPKNREIPRGLKILSKFQSLAQVRDNELIVDESVDIALAKIADTSRPKIGVGT